jgi:hypothetical protein
MPTKRKKATLARLRATKKKLREEEAAYERLYALHSDLRDQLYDLTGLGRSVLTGLASMLPGAVGPTNILTALREMVVPADLAERAKQIAKSEGDRYWGQFFGTDRAHPLLSAATK